MMDSSNPGFAGRRLPRITRRLDRRAFLGTASLSLAGLAFGCSRESVAAAGSTATPGPVTLVQFGNDGRRIRTVTVPKIVKSDAEWRRQLSPLSYQVTRRDGTERAFTGPLLKTQGKGVFRCICCDTALFDAATKYDSGTGWPSFWQPIARQNVREPADRSFGMVRTAADCARCDAHLGHVFDDGPRPTGLRYCINSAALRFARATPA